MQNNFLNNLEHNNNNHFTAPFYGPLENTNNSRKVLVADFAP